MTNILETVIILGTTTGIVAMFTHVSNKAVKAAHEKEIEFIKQNYQAALNGVDNDKKRLQADINTLVSELYTDEEKRLIKNYYINKMNMRESILNAMNK